MEWKRLIWYRASPALIVILGISYAADGLSALPSGLVAWGTILLAFVTFQLVRSVTEQEKRRREEKLAKERRDRDVTLLNDIIEWATRIVEVGMPTENVVLVGTMDEKAYKRLIVNTLISLRNNFRALIAKSLCIVRISLVFGEKLQHCIDKLDGDLRKQEDLIQKCLEIAVKGKPSEYNDAWAELIDHWGTLGDSAAGVIDEAIIEKLNILNI